MCTIGQGIFRGHISGGTMARIRSIKPEFWTDGKVRRLSDTTALFFISLWNFADDYGYFPLDTLELSMKVARWRSQDVMRLLSALHRAGMVALSAGHGVGKIEGWEHQKIKDRRASKWNDFEITWDEPKIDAPRSDKNRPRIGEDRIGEDRISTQGVTPPATTAKNPGKLTPKKGKREAPTSATWQAYADAYFLRYGLEPVRNATVNSQLANFVGRLGAEDAPQVAAFYLRHNDQFYLKQLHAVGPMVANAEALRTQWKRNQAVTTQDARNTERMAANANAFAGAFAAVEQAKGADRGVNDEA